MNRKKVRRRRALRSMTSDGLLRGRCRACGCTDFSPCAHGCAWSDRSETHCTACFCADCGRKFLSSSDYRYRDGLRVCRSAKRCKPKVAASAHQA